MCTDLGRGEVSILKSFFSVLGGWFSGYVTLPIVLLDLAAQTGMS
jgi:hypothetical protein